MRLWLLIILSFSLFTLKAQTRTINSSGNWSNSSIWNGGNIGGATSNTDAVNMSDGIDIVIQSGETYTIASLNVSKEGSITIQNGGTLIITGTVIVDKQFTFNVSGTLTAGSMSIAKELVMNVGTTGNLSVQGDVTMAKQAFLTIDGDVTVGGDFQAGQESNINVTSSGSMSVSGDFTPGSNTTIDGSGPISVGQTCNGTTNQCTDSQINNTLPILLGSFELKRNQEKITLNWTTLSELNFEYFEIQRANASGEFSTIATVPGHGNSKDIIHYNWTDENPQIGINYYRLISNDFDGYREVFQTERYTFENSLTPISFFPNPVSNNQTIQIQGVGGSVANVKIFDMNGQLKMEVNSIQQTPNLDQLNPGVYLINIEVNGYQKSGKLRIDF